MGHGCNTPQAELFRWAVILNALRALRLMTLSGSVARSDGRPNEMPPFYAARISFAEKVA